MSKIRKRLSDQQAKFLGLEIKEKKWKGNPKYQITEGQLLALNSTKFAPPSPILTLDKKELIRLEVGNKSESKSNEYKNKEDKKFVISAWSAEGFMMDIDQYCEHYKLPRKDISSYKLISHTNIPYYNIVFKENVIESELDIEEIKEIIGEELSNSNTTSVTVSSGSSIGVVKIADLHLGSYVDNLIRTKDFSINILAEKLTSAAHQINERQYKEVHVHLLGDLIESFTGLNHKNSWKGLDKTMVGAEVVKMTCKILQNNLLSKINNLKEVKIVAGNHDRVTSDNKEDVRGDAASLIAWGLELMGYSVEFNPLVLSHNIEGICHILTHGHFGISKKSTQQICWDYGEQGKFNLITEGHLHSIYQQIAVSQRDKFQTIKDDAVDHRRVTCPSFFTGNFFSESIGYTSESGFIIVEDNGFGVPNMFYYAV